jgi:hypothetical protein
VRDRKGRFLSGPDWDRHQFTADERSRGGRTTFHRAMDDAPWLLRWLQRKIDATRQRAG